MNARREGGLKLFLLRRLRQERRQRACWVRPILIRRGQTGDVATQNLSRSNTVCILQVHSPNRHILPPRPLLSRHSPRRRRAESTMPSELHVQLQSSEIASGTSAPHDRTQHTPPRCPPVQSATRRVISISPQNIHVCLSKPKITCRSKHLGWIMISFIVLSFFHFSFSFFSVAISRFFELLISFFSRSPPVEPYLCIAMERVVFRDRKNEKNEIKKRKSAPWSLYLIPLVGLKGIELCVYDPLISIIIKLKKLRHGIKQLNHSQEEKSVKRLAYRLDV